MSSAFILGRISGLEHSCPAEDTVVKAILVEQVVDAVDAGIAGHTESFDPAHGVKYPGLVFGRSDAGQAASN